MRGAAGGVGDIRQTTPQADACPSSIAFRKLTHPFPPTAIVCRSRFVRVSRTLTVPTAAVPCPARPGPMTKARPVSPSTATCLGLGPMVTVARTAPLPVECATAAPTPAASSTKPSTAHARAVERLCPIGRRRSRVARLTLCPRAFLLHHQTLHPSPVSYRREMCKIWAHDHGGYNPMEVWDRGEDDKNGPHGACYR